MNLRPGVKRFAIARAHGVMRRTAIFTGATITEGSVDSTIGVHQADPNGSFQFYYWIAAGTSRIEVANLNNHVLTRGSANYFLESEGFWRDG